MKRGHDTLHDAFRIARIAASGVALAHTVSGRPSAVPYYALVGDAFVRLIADVPVFRGLDAGARAALMSTGRRRVSARQGHRLVRIADDPLV